MKLHKNLQCRLTVKIFISAENGQSLNNRKVKCKQIEENYRIFHSFAGNAEFCRFFRVLQTYAELCRKMQTISFSASVPLFLNTRKKVLEVLEIHNFLKYFKYSVFEIPVLKIPKKSPCT